MRQLLVLVVACVLALGTCVGCGMNSGQQMTAAQAQDFLTQHQHDVTMVTKALTMAAIDKGMVTSEKLQKLKDFVSAAHLLLIDPDKPDFDGVEALAEKMLPPEYLTIAKVSMDILEGKLREVLPKVPEKAKAYQQIVAATMDGIMQAINSRT